MDDWFGALDGLAMVVLAILIVVILVSSDGDSGNRKPVHETRMSAVERIEYEHRQQDQAEDDLVCGGPVNASGC